MIDLQSSFFMPKGPSEIPTGLFTLHKGTLNSLVCRSYSKHRKKFITAMADIRVQRLPPQDNSFDCNRGDGRETVYSRVPPKRSQYLEGSTLQPRHKSFSQRHNAFTPRPQPTSSTSSMPRTRATRTSAPRY